jgi:hypothetical protein
MFQCKSVIDTFLDTGWKKAKGSGQNLETFRLFLQICSALFRDGFISFLFFLRKPTNI